jgi:hypothetical protein
MGGFSALSFIRGDFAGDLGCLLLADSGVASDAINALTPFATSRETSSIGAGVFVSTLKPETAGEGTFSCTGMLDCISKRRSKVEKLIDMTRMR